VARVEKVTVGDSAVADLEVALAATGWAAALEVVGSVGAQAAVDLEEAQEAADPVVLEAEDSEAG